MPQETDVELEQAETGNVKPETRPRGSYWNSRTQTILLFALAFLIYGFGVSRDFQFDDFVYIAHNPLLRRPDAFHAFWCSSEAFNYYPLFWSLLWVQYLLWGVHPLGYHLVNLLMHSVDAVLVWRVARAWRLPGAWWVAAIFAVHPVNAQTVAWAAEQKNTWSFFFMGLSLLAFIRHVEKKSWGPYAFSLLAFAAALACKTSTVCLPVFLLFCYGFRPGRERLPMLLRLVPYFVLGFAAGLTTVWFEKHRVAAHSLVGSLSLWQRLEISGATFWFYLEKALVPVGLTPMYQGWVDTNAATHTFLPGALLVALLIVCGLFWRRIGAPIALGIFYYALMLLPLLGIFDTNYFAYSLVADHWQYHALPGLIVAVVAALKALAERWPRLAQQANVAGGITVAGLAALASTHFAHFEDTRSLWTYVVERNPDAWMGWYNLGTVYADDHKPVEAIAAYRQSLRIKPDYYRCRFNLANALAAAGQLAEADRAYLEAAKLEDVDPDVHNNRAVTLMRLGREDDAVQEFNRALGLEPDDVSAHINLTAIFLKRGQIDQAAKNLEAVHSLSPANAHRIAEAITAASGNSSIPHPGLAHFAERACQLSGNAPELQSALQGLRQ
ncbi:MAG TPA: tetratricopeptide repeat protein [Chthoniobacter sp.]|jgi:tetratricopeptide (TPR) repeat protein